MSESGVATTAEERSDNRRSRYHNIRNQNLATIASMTGSYKGKNKKIVVLGKAHEKAATFEKFMEDVKEYVSMEFDQGNDLELLIESQVDDFDTAAETKLPTLKSQNDSDKVMFEQDYAEYRQREKAYKINKKKLLGLLHGQCTPTLIASIKSQTGYSEKFKQKDVLWLMKTMQKLSIGIDDNGNDLLIAHDTVRQVYNLSQGRTETNDSYMERFKEVWNAAVASSGSASCLVHDVMKTSNKYKNMTDAERVEAAKAMYFFVHADRMRYGAIINQVNAGVVLGTDQYPNCLDKAYAILTDTQIQLERERLRRSGGNNNTLSGQGQSNFQNDRAIPEGENIVVGTNRRVFSVQCNRCNAWGHYANFCRQVSNTVSKEKRNTNITDNNLTSLCYILDTGSTHNTVKDSDDLVNITNLFNNKVLNMRSSTGDVMRYFKKGTLKPFDIEAYFNKNTAANILAFHTLTKLKDAYMVYDSRDADCFRLIYNNGKELQFQNCGDGLYTFVNPKDNRMFDYKREHTDVTTNSDRHTQYVQTVEQNEKLMTNKEIERAQASRDLQEYLGWPSTQEYINIINGNEIRNIDVTVDDIKRAITLYGEPTQCLRGKMTRRRPLSHDTLEFLQQPLPIELHDKRIELFIDLYKFAGTWFIIIESSRIKYIDIEVIANQGIDHVVEHVTRCIRKYKSRGLQISGIHVDNQFYKSEFQRAIEPTILIPYAANEHVAVIERRIRTVKERMRAILSGLPYKTLPKMMVRGLVIKVKMEYVSYKKGWSIYDVVPRRDRRRYSTLSYRKHIQHHLYFYCQTSHHHLWKRLIW